MGAFRGSITFSKFHVEGELQKRFRERFLERIRLRAFRPLDPKEEIDHRVGWCSIDDPFDLELTYEKVFLTDYLVLGFRMDRWRIPTPLFKAAYRAAERDFLAKRGVEKLSRGQRKNLQAIVAAQLRKRLVPAMRASDVSWGLSSGIVRFFQKSQKQNELLVELFEKTFELELVPDGAYVAAERRGLPKRALDALPKLDPSSFARSEVVIPATEEA
jgi:recombination associated protein RdgC